MNPDQDEDHSIMMENQDIVQLSFHNAQQSTAVISLDDTQHQQEIEKDLGSSSGSYPAEKYTLNKKLALCKKRAACDRNPFQVKANKSSTTITMNTVVFEHFRSHIENYLRSRKYKVLPYPVPDRVGNITKDIVRVMNNETHMYTINVYRTSSRIMINGPRYMDFVRNDIPIIQQDINRMSKEFECANELAKQNIEQELHVQQKDSYAVDPEMGGGAHDAKSKAILPPGRKVYPKRNRPSTEEGEDVDIDEHDGDNTLLITGERLPIDAEQVSPQLLLMQLQNIEPDSTGEQLIEKYISQILDDVLTLVTSEHQSPIFNYCENTDESVDHQGTITLHKNGPKVLVENDMYKDVLDDHTEPVLACDKSLRKCEGNNITDIPKNTTENDTMSLTTADVESEKAHTKSGHSVKEQPRIVIYEPLQMNMHNTAADITDSTIQSIVDETRPVMHTEVNLETPDDSRDDGTHTTVNQVTADMSEVTQLINLKTNTESTRLVETSSTNETTYCGSARETTVSGEIANDHSATNDVRRSNRTIKKTEKGQMVNQTKRPRKTKGEVPKQEQLDPICPNCKLVVDENSDGIVCEACLAYWHYECAGVDDKMVKSMNDDQDYYCVHHRQSVANEVENESKLPNLQQTNPDLEPNLVDIVEIKQEMNDMKLALNAKITSLEDEVQYWKDKQYSLQEALKAKENSKIELRKKSERIISLEGEIVDLKQQHEKTLDKKQITLDSLGNTIASQKRDILKYQKQIKEIQDEKMEFEERFNVILTENKQLKADNEAHLEIAKSVITSNPSAAIDNEKLVADFQELHMVVQERDDEIKELQKRISSDAKTIDKNKDLLARIADKNKELKQIKTQIGSLEDQLGEEKVSKEACERDLNVRTAELEREKELNKLLTRKHNEIADQRSPDDVSHSTKVIRESKRKLRGFCCHELLTTNSCPFGNNCMFSHDISEETRKNPSEISEAQKRKAGISSRNIRRQHPGEPVNHDQICENVFQYGSCTMPQCSKFHELDLQRVKRGICHLYVLDSCQRHERCWFSHEIPSCIKKDIDTIRQAKDFVKSRNEKYVDQRRGNNTTLTERSREVLTEDENRHDGIEAERSGICSRSALPTQHSDSGGAQDNKMVNNNQLVGEGSKQNNKRMHNDLSKQKHKIHVSGVPKVCFEPQNSNPQQKPQPTLQLPSHDSFLLLIKTTIQDQIRQMLQTVPYPQFYPTLPIQYPNSQQS